MLRCTVGFWGRAKDVSHVIFHQTEAVITITQYGRAFCSLCISSACTVNNTQRNES